MAKRKDGTSTGKAQSQRGKSPTAGVRPASGTPSRRSPPTGAASGVQVCQQPDGSWVIVPPRCARERAADIEEVVAMIEGDELEIARDELQWLLQDCPENVTAHELLGEIALHEQDYALARGHFGFAWELVNRALRKAGNPRPLLFSVPQNQPFFAAGKGLVLAMLELKMRDRALEIFEVLQACDAGDPLSVREVLFPSPDSAAGAPPCAASAGPQIVELRIFPRPEIDGESA